ncbi:fatty acid desaturase family protein [Acinetobacter larvae]|uniref:Acyl-CoA desaturase n=1 Tax=Acinetobacter larvae TaxID=1789224 RepID=A0A1B2LVM3_9GAMM|nr:acyl-CoA desaturase [Acinetobacter larvae]AOA56978.1 acyl-CoA desaturase [Acinetobacter larvae]
MNMSQQFFPSQHVSGLSTVQIEQFGQRIDEIRQRIILDLGEKDARYIRKIRNFVRYSEAGARTLLTFAAWLPPVWLAATALLGVSKIVENMELGHNVMHGQFDWLNDQSLNGSRYDWDTIATGDDWRYCHNYIHHTYTNIVGQDHDVGYGLLRVSQAQPWEVRFIWNIPLAIQLMLFFEWYVGLQNLHLEDVMVYKRKTWSAVWQQSAGVRRKALRQVLKDYVFFPAISGINAPAVFTANFTANIIRNIWASAVIFTGHFTEQAQTFSQVPNGEESRAEWYIRQILGSSNFTGAQWLHILSGNLSHQIEHHLFPDLPANRYAEIAPEIEALCQEYGLYYNQANFAKQFLGVWQRLAEHALPDDLSISETAALLLKRSGQGLVRRFKARWRN